jgi:hypothetical protein
MSSEEEDDVLLADASIIVMQYKMKKKHVVYGWQGSNGTVLTIMGAIY